MSDREVGFIIWAFVGCILIGIGIWTYFTIKPVGFWANVKPMKVQNIKGYHHATGRLWIAYGIIFTLLGLPLLDQQNSLLLLLSILGVVFETIALMAIYALYITPKYQADK